MTIQLSKLTNDDIWIFKLVWLTWRRALTSVRITSVSTGPLCLSFQYNLFPNTCPLNWSFDVIWNNFGTTAHNLMMSSCSHSRSQLKNWKEVSTVSTPAVEGNGKRFKVEKFKIGQAAPKLWPCYANFSFLK